MTLVLLAASTASAQFIEVRPSDIPFDNSDSLVRVQVEIDGRAAAHFLIDSAAVGSVIDEGLAAALRLRREGRQTSHGAGGDQSGSIVHGATLGLPGFQLVGRSMDALALGALSARTGSTLDGIIGSPLFESRVVEIDYPRHLLRLYDPAGYTYTGAGTIVPIEVRHAHPYVRGRAVLPGGKVLEGLFVVDTGASSGLILSSAAIVQDGLMDSIGKTLPVQGYGVGGAAGLLMTRVDRFELAGHALARPIAFLQPEGSRGHISAPGTIGNIGGGILERFKVIFDYSRNRMILEPGRDFARPFEADMSGLVLTTVPGDWGRVIIASVREGSPASEAGAKAGDVIESIEGISREATSAQYLRRRFREDSTEFKMVVLRGTERIHLTLHTRRMI